MLVLSRHKNEKVIINHNIEIVVVEIRGDKVRLGVNAPSHVPVHREEVEQAVLAQHGTKQLLHSKVATLLAHIEQLSTVEEIDISTLEKIRTLTTTLINPLMAKATTG